MRTRLRLLLVSVFVLSVAAAACKSKGKGGGGSSVQLLGDMTGAVGVGVTKVASAFAFAATGTAGVFSELVKIDANGNVTPVLSATRETYAVLLTSNYVIASGDYHDVLTTMVDSSGGGFSSINCHLVAIPRSAAGAPAACLETAPIGAFGLPGANQLTGLATDGTRVFFASSGSSTEPEFKRWVEGATATEILIKFTTNSELFAQPVAVKGVANVCVTTLLQNGGGGSPRTLCGAADGSTWNDVSIVPTSGPDSTWYVLGPRFITNDHALDLRTLTQTVPVKTETGLAPANVPFSMKGFVTLQDGRAVAVSRGVSSTLQLLDTAGNSTQIDATVAWEKILGDDNYAYAYGASTLKRIDRATAVVGTANLISGIGLLQVTDFSISTDHRLRLDGTGNSGAPVIVQIDTVTGDVTVTTEDLPRMEQVVPLQ